ncbi:hypothetical protein Q0S81_28350 [Escherichia coli O10]
MKKTLIALAVAASAAVSGSAMAWTANGTGGSVDLGGTLTPVEKVTPWEVKVGDAVTGLDGQIQKGQQNIDVAVNKVIPVLGIRTIESKAFIGKSGIAPQIDFKGAINTANFSQSVTTLTLDVKNDKAQKIGRLQAPLFAGAEYSFKGPNSGKLYMSGNNAGDAFYGGLGKNGQTIGSDVQNRVRALDSEYLAHYDEQGTSYNGHAPTANNFSDTAYSFSAYYGAGIEANSVIKIALDAPAGADVIAWKASLPVTVSYQ